MTPELMLALLLILLSIGLLSGFPVAFVLAGVSLWCALIGNAVGIFDLSYIHAFPDRVFGIMSNDLLMAVPLFVFMGVMLERARIAEALLTTMADLFGGTRSGIGLSVMLVGALLAASTGIVGATVVTMGLISLPVMLKRDCCVKNSCGTIAAAGTLGQIIPPSIVLILLSDQISNANQTAQMAIGNVSPEPVSIADVFMGALIPGFMLVVFYIIWILTHNKTAKLDPTDKRPMPSLKQVVRVLVPPILLILLVLGSILTGVATATESASVGAVGSMILAILYKQFSYENLKAVCQETLKTSCMVFAILIGAAMFSLVFRGYGGDDMVHDFLNQLPGGFFGAMLLVMVMVFLLGFFLDFIEIIYVVVPIVAPILLKMGADPIWLAIMLAINLQTSFLTPPFGFALFYLRGVAPKQVKTSDIYRGVIPFVAIQLVMLLLLSVVPDLATWLPKELYGTDFEAPATITPETNSIEIHSIDF